MLAEDEIYFLVRDLDVKRINVVQLGYAASIFSLRARLRRIINWIYNLYVIADPTI